MYKCGDKFTKTQICHPPYTKILIMIFEAQLNIWQGWAQRLKCSARRALQNCNWNFYDSMYGCGHRLRMAQICHPPTHTKFVTPLHIQNLSPLYPLTSTKICDPSTQTFIIFVTPPDKYKICHPLYPLTSITMCDPPLQNKIFY